MSGTSERTHHLADVRGMSDGQLISLMGDLMGERLRRAVSGGDPDVIVSQAMQAMFGSSGEPTPPRIFGPLVAVAGMVQDVSATRHTCKLFTVKLPDGSPERWSWEDSLSSYVHDESEKVGKVRRGVSLHVAVEGAVLVQHSMSKRDGEGHTRNGAKAWEVRLKADDNGEVTGASLVQLTDWTPSHLPAPHSTEDARSYAGRGR